MGVVSDLLARLRWRVVAFDGGALRLREVDPLTGKEVGIEAERGSDNGDAFGGRFERGELELLEDRGGITGERVLCGLGAFACEVEPEHHLCPGAARIGCHPG